MSRYRESLAKAYNSLGVIERDTGDLPAAETYLRRELPLVDRSGPGLSPTAPNIAANWAGP